MKFSRIKIARQGNFILGLFLIYFLFFGFICLNFIRDLYGQVDIGDRLLFLNQILFNPNTYWSFIILFGIMFFVASRESFYEYAIRNSIWYVPAIMIMSWFWYWILYGFDPTVIYIYFIQIEGYLTILSLLCINLFAVILASSITEKRKELRTLE
ncbi:MAG: hypothetical protein KAX18_04205 [Candidatus Lokiarchaeota archaeon]|nr:hypothetical protein [Candidatus Lokiarchaeota archaeon]